MPQIHCKKQQKIKESKLCAYQTKLHRIYSVKRATLVNTENQDTDPHVCTLLNDKKIFCSF